MNEKTINRFWLKCNIRNNKDCWNWNAGTNNSYGWFGIKNNNKTKCYYAHRLSWELTNGLIPNEKCVLHKCDNTLCVNPNHLFLGSKKDNAIDKVKKRRQLKGSDVPTSKLVEFQVKEIRNKRPFTTIEKLSLEYNVSKGTIMNICALKSWKHVL